jgi:hypothetical protein
MGLFIKTFFVVLMETMLAKAIRNIISRVSRGRL